MNQSLARATFDASFVTFLSEAPMEEIEDAYCESYKDAHGIKARWIYGCGYTREEFADMFVSLGEDIKAENAREDMYQESFREKASNLGLTEWLTANGITTTYDLMEQQDRQAWDSESIPAPFPYEMLAIRAGWGEPGRMVNV